MIVNCFIFFVLIFMSLMPEDVEGWKNFQSHYSQFGKMDKLYQSLRNDLTSDSFEEIVDDPFKARFSNVGRLYDGDLSLNRLKSASVCVIGLGGVGSWVVEALARSGVGKLTLFDMDDICVTNTNRQVMAQESSIGKFKAEVLKARILDINPSAEVTTVIDFIRKENAIDYLCSSLAQEAITPSEEVCRKYDYVVDAADGVSDKAAIIDACVRSGTPIVTSGGVGGLVDPSLITISDITQAAGDNLIMRVRKKLRQDYNYPKTTPANSGKRTKKWFITAVHTLPTGTRRENGMQACDMTQKTASSFRKCDGGMGNACFVTGTVGFMIGSVVVNAIASGQVPVPRNPNQPVAELSLSNVSNNVSPGIVLGQDNENSEGCCCGEGDTKECGQSAEIPIPSLYEKLSTVIARDNITESLFDAHCHIQLDPLFDRADDSIAAALELGLKRIAICGTCPGEDWDRIKLLYQRHTSFVVPNFGLHPWWISRYAKMDKMDSSKIAFDDSFILELQVQLEECLVRFPMAGVGECGLDKAVKKDVDLSLQVKVFEMHLKLAQMYTRPLTIHCVSGCWGTLLQILEANLLTKKSSSQPKSIILHSCNTMPLNMLGNFSSIPNLFFSVSGRVLQERSIPLLKAIPITKLLVETDSPDQIPLDLRDSFACNEPGIIRYISAEIAKCRSLSPNELVAITAANAMRAFGLTDG